MKIRHQLTTALLFAAVPLSTFATPIPASPVANNTQAPNASAKLTDSPEVRCKNTAAVLNDRSRRLGDTKAAAVKHYADARKIWVGRVATAKQYQTKKSKTAVTQKSINAYEADLAKYDKAVGAFSAEYDAQITAFKNTNVNCTAAGRAQLNIQINAARTGRAKLLADQKIVHDTAVDQVIPDVKDIIDQFHAIKTSKEGYKKKPVPQPVTTQ